MSSSHGVILLMICRVSLPIRFTVGDFCGQFQFQAQVCDAAPAAIVISYILIGRDCAWHLCAGAATGKSVSRVFRTSARVLEYCRPKNAGLGRIFSLTSNARSVARCNQRGHSRRDRKSQCHRQRGTQWHGWVVGLCSWLVLIPCLAFSGERRRHVSELASDACRADAALARDEFFRTLTARSCYIARNKRLPLIGAICAWIRVLGLPSPLVLGELQVS